MELSQVELNPRYRRILGECKPFVISYPSNYSALNLAPFGVTIAEEHRYTATSLNSRDVVDGLHYLDAATFADQGMQMPRWVLFDCGEFPGIVFGFGKRSHELSDAAREHYRVSDRDDVFVPLSMWVAIRCAEDGAWFGHNLSSANVVLDGEATLPGLATITKSLGVKLTGATQQYGATQWPSKSIRLHLRLGDLQLLSAYTPAHTHPNTFAYRIHVSDENLLRSLLPGYQEAPAGDAQIVHSNDHALIRSLHDEIEAGTVLHLVHAAIDPMGGQRLAIVRKG